MNQISTDSIPQHNWKKHNLPELKERWDNYGAKYCDNFDEFCKNAYLCLCYSSKLHSIPSEGKNGKNALIKSK